MKSFGFHTLRFPTEPEGDLDYCNGKPGSAAAEWCREVLTRHGIKTRDLIQEDYGWGFWLANESLAVWVAVGVMDGDDEEGGSSDAPAWGVLVSHEPFILSRERWLRRRQGRELEERVNDLLRAAAENTSDMEVFAM